MEENKTLGNLVSSLGAAHVELWHEEDKARVENDAQVAKAKRNIDKLNQKRNDLVEKIDEFILEKIKQYQKSKKGKK